MPSLAILTRNATPPPAFPIDAFGPLWADWIAQAAEGANAPPDYVALPLLAAASALTGNAIWAKAWQGWAEPPVLWCGSVGNPSSGKSPGAAPVLGGVMRIVEARMSRDYPEAIERWNTAAEIARAVLKNWESAVAKAVKKDQEIPEKPDAALVPPKPIRPRASVVDVTTEKLATIYEALPKGVLYRRDELAGWLLNLSRYSNGGTDRPFWLEAYVGGPHQVDRVKNPEPVLISHLACAVFGTIQPERLIDALGGADDGLAGRFLWTWPEPRPFDQPQSTCDEAAAAERLSRLAELTMPKDEAGRPHPSYMRLAADAVPILRDFGREMQAAENASTGLLKSAIGKARGQALRLALVLEMLWWTAGDHIQPVEISCAAMLAAADMMDRYFLPMAKRVLADASIPERRAQRAHAGKLDRRHMPRTDQRLVRARRSQTARVARLRRCEGRMSISR